MSNGKHRRPAPGSSVKHRGPVPKARIARAVPLTSSAAVVTVAFVSAFAVTSYRDSAGAHLASADISPDGSLIGSTAAERTHPGGPTVAGSSKTSSGAVTKDSSVGLAWLSQVAAARPSEASRGQSRLPLLHSSITQRPWAPDGDGLGGRDSSAGGFRIPTQPVPTRSPAAPAARVGTLTSTAGKTTSVPTTKVIPTVTAAPKPTAKPTITPKPTATPTPTRVPTKAPTPAPPVAGHGARSASEFPNAAGTGVPAGVILRASGPLTITTPGTAISGLDISGCVDVAASGVTITNSRIRCATNGSAVDVLSGSVKIVNSEIDGLGTTDQCIGFDNFTLVGVDIYGCQDGIKLGSNDVVENSYVHNLARGDGSHNDAIQTVGGHNDVVRHNTLMAYNAATDDPMNAAIQTGHLNNPLTNVVIDDNYMDGGNYTVNAGSQSTDGNRISGYVFTNNVFGPDARYGPVAELGDGISFDSSNVWTNGSPVH
jgi:hypothetical protein